MIYKIKTFLAFGLEKALYEAPRFMLAILLFWIGLKLLKPIDKFVDNLLRRINIGETIRPFIISIVNFLYYALLFFVFLYIVGVDLSLFASIVAASVFAIGMSLQGSLSNFASGLLILSLRPYKVNDFVQIDDKFGRIDKIDIFSTLMSTPSNKRLVVPNSKLTSEIVTNYSEKGIILLNLEVSIPYAEDFPKIKQLLEEKIADLPLVKAEPKVVVGIKNFDSHSIVLAVRPYIDPENYWEATFSVNATIKQVFNENNVKVAYSEGVELGEIGK